jgi:hypothetical protein
MKPVTHETGDVRQVIERLVANLERYVHPAGEGHRYWRALKDALSKLSAQPAPSGWQQRIAAMNPWVDVRCFFCGVRQVPIEHPHASDCLWQNAVNALPPALEVKGSTVPPEPEPERCIECGADVCICEPDAKDALPPVPEGATAKCVDCRAVQQWVGPQGRCRQHPHSEADASPVKEER